MKLHSLMISFILFLSATAGAVQETVVSRLFQLGKLDGKPLFIQTTKIEKTDPQSFTSEAKIEDSKGAVMMTETVVVKDGVLVSQKVSQLQTSQAWDLKVTARKATYQTFKISASGSQQLTHEGSVDVGPDFMNGPMIELFMAKSWPELTQGKSVKAQFSVLELEKPVLFEFKKEKDGLRDGQKVLVVKMKPANFFISMLVDSIFLEFRYEDKRLVYFKGRTPLKIPEENKMVPLDAEILYSVQ